MPAPLVLRVLDVNRERNVPTAWSVALLLAGAWAAARLAREQVRGWWLLAALLLARAADEALHFAWVVPGALASAVAALLLLRSLHGVPALVRRRLAVAAVVYLGGALLVEALSGLVLDTVGRSLVYALCNGLEEGLEMTGACLLLGALLLARGPVREPGAARRRPTSLGR